MGQDSQGARELIDLIIALGAWAVSIFAVSVLFKVYVLPHISF